MDAAFCESFVELDVIEAGNVVERGPRWWHSVNMFTDPAIGRIERAMPHGWCPAQGR
jgi:hypothetical protein